MLQVSPTASSFAIANLTLFYLSSVWWMAAKSKQKSTHSRLTFLLHIALNYISKIQTWTYHSPLKILQRLLLVFQKFLKSLAHLARLFTIWLMPNFLASSPTTPSHLPCGPVIPDYPQDLSLTLLTVCFYMLRVPLPPRPSLLIHLASLFSSLRLCSNAFSFWKTLASDWVRCSSSVFPLYSVTTSYGALPTL